MLETQKEDTQAIDFLKTFEELRVVVEKAQLIHKIEETSAQSEKANPAQLERIKHELKIYRDQLRQLALEFS